MATVLVVDDEPSLRGLIRRALERAGHQVLEAGEGGQALALLEAHRGTLGVAVLDQAIPPAGALDLLEQSKPRDQEIGLVVISGHAPDEALRTHIEGRGGVFLRKPFLPRALVAAVDRLGKRS